MKITAYSDTGVPVFEREATAQEASDLSSERDSVSYLVYETGEHVRITRQHRKISKDVFEQETALAKEQNAKH